MKPYQILLLFLLMPVIIKSQSLAINTDGSTAHPNAMLDIKGINKGLLIPRGDAATRTALNANTAKGLLMYDTVLNTVWLHNGNGLATGWNSLSTGTNYWQLNGALGTEIKNTNTGGFWSANGSTVVSDPGAIQPPVSGAGTRLMWMPQKSAFRVGTVTGNDWNADSIGVYSFAAGIDVRAKGVGAIALGFESVANQSVAFAAGYRANATGGFSVAIGENTVASETYSVAIGRAAQSMGNTAVAIGNNVSAQALWSHAIGNFNQSYAIGSSSMGNSTITNSYNSMTMGQFNDTLAGANRTSWINTEPLLQVGNGTAAASRHNAMVLYKNGNLVLKNPTTVLSDPSGYTVPISGTGTRMMWLPEKSAFRAGTVTSIVPDAWDATNIGIWSAAFGTDNKILGANSFATGSSNDISSFGFGSAALGQNNTVDGGRSTAIGMNNIVNGNYSTAIGHSNTVDGDYALGTGFVTRATGNYSFSQGNGTKALGNQSASFGNSTVASGDLSFVTGLSNTSRSYASLTIGRYADSIITSTKSSWVDTDPLLILGNGTATNARNNAVVFYKNGNADISGYTQLGKPTEGSPAIKIKKLTVNTPNLQGACAFVAHGITQSKILSISALVTIPGGFQILPNHVQTGLLYTLNVDNGNIAVCTASGNSGSILNMPVKILVVYEE